MTETDGDGLFAGDFDDPAEEDGVLEPADSLESEDLRADVLDTGVDAGEGYRGVNRFGTTLDEERRGESLSDLLAEEEPEVADPPWTDEEFPTDDGRVPERRAGRLLAPDEGSEPAEERDSVASEVGADGGGASAEEAAVYLTDDPPFDELRP